MNKRALKKEHEKDIMKFQIQLQCTSAGKYAAVPEIIALTSDPYLIKQVIEGLCANYLAENDEQDRVFDSAFLRSAPAVIADLTREIRREACRGWPKEKTGAWPEEETGGSPETPDG